MTSWKSGSKRAPIRNPYNPISSLLRPLFSVSNLNYPFETAHSRDTPTATYRWPRYDTFVGSESHRTNSAQLRLACSFKPPSSYFLLFFFFSSPLPSTCRLGPFCVHIAALLTRTNPFALEILKCHEYSRNAIN